MQYTDRLKAIAWWDVKSTQYKDALVHIHFQGRNIKSLTGREIEIIWRKETHEIHHYKDDLLGQRGQKIWNYVSSKVWQYYLTDINV